LTETRYAGLSMFAHLLKKSPAFGWTFYIGGGGGN
jgi:hypothetical protein